MSVLRQKAGATTSAEASQMDPAVPRHPRGGPFPHLQDGYRADLPRLIQHARGLIHSGTEPMEVGRFVAEQALGAADLRCALGYLLSAAITAGGLAVIRSRLQYSVSAANAGELMEPLGSLRCGDCGDVALPTHRCPALQRQVERELADASPEPTLAVSARVGDGSTPAAPGSEHRPCALCNEQVWASPATLALKPDSFICTSCYSRSRPAPGAA